MTKHDIEAFVRRMLTQTFNQKADTDTVRAVAEKMAKTIPQKPEKRSSRRTFAR